MVWKIFTQRIAESTIWRMRRGGQGQTQATMPFPVATTFDDKPYINRKAGSHMNIPGYNGADARGWSLSSSKNIWLKDAVVKGCKSLWGASYGIDMHFQTSTVYIENFSASDIDGASMQNLDTYSSNPTTDPNSFAIRVGASVSKVDIQSAEIEMGRVSKDASKMSTMNDSTTILS